MILLNQSGAARDKLVLAHANERSALENITENEILRCVSVSILKFTK